MSSNLHMLYYKVQTLSWQNTLLQRFSIIQCDILLLTEKLNLYLNVSIFLFHSNKRYDKTKQTPTTF